MLRKTSVDLGHEINDLMLVTLLISILGKPFSSWRRKVYEKSVDEVVFEEVARSAIAEEPYVTKPAKDNSQSQTHATGSDGNKKSNKDGHNNTNTGGERPKGADAPDMSKPKERCAKHPWARHTNEECSHAPGNTPHGSLQNANKTRSSNSTSNQSKGNNAYANKATTADDSDNDDLSRYRPFLGPRARGFNVKEHNPGSLDLAVDCDTEYIVDGGAERHCIADKSKFIYLEPFTASIATYGDTPLLKVLGIGTVLLETLDLEGKVSSLLLKNAWWVPSGIYNLISTNMLEDDGI